VINSVAGTAPDLFNSAIVYEAKVLDRRDLGRIEVDAKADLVVIDLNTIRMSPVRDLIRNLVYGATDQDVDRVIIDEGLLSRTERYSGWTSIS